jgi:hypothetical protein
MSGNDLRLARTYDHQARRHVSCSSDNVCQER